MTDEKGNFILNYNKSDCGIGYLILNENKPIFVILNEESCTVNNDLAKQLETYRAMKKGNISPEIIFTKSNFSNPIKSFNKLSDVKSKDTLIVFGASWCPKCNEELPNITKLYEKWKSMEIEVIFIGLENERKSFMDFTKNFAFSSYSDLKKMG